MSKVKALISGFVGHDGIPVLLHEGEEWPADDPFVQARPDLFSEPPAVESKRASMRPRGRDADG